MLKIITESQALCSRFSGRFSCAARDFAISSQTDFERFFSVLLLSLSEQIRRLFDVCFGDVGRCFSNEIHLTLYRFFFLFTMQSAALSRLLPSFDDENLIKKTFTFSSIGIAFCT
jgi:hypothetical protein